MSEKGPLEVALSTDLRSAPYSFNLWDIHTGAQLVSFKSTNGAPISHCVHQINANYFITAVDNVVQVWSIYNRKSQEQKLFLPGRPSTLITSPCGNYLMVGISEMIYIWQLNSGNLLAHTQRHYQTVTVLKTNHDGTFLFSGGEDGVVLVWPFADIIANTHNTGSLGLSHTRADAGINEPRFSWQHHSAKITDIHVANSGLCLTSSIDKTVNIYNYHSGKRVHCVADWPSPISSLVMNKNETRLFLGGHDGNIYELAISSLSLSLINSRENDGDGQRRPILTGHTDKVSKILISMDGTLLISASHDSSVKIWDIMTGKMLRDVKHQAPLANIISFLIPDSFALTCLSQSRIQPPYLVKPLKRSVLKVPRDTPVFKSDLFEESGTTIISVKNKVDLYEGCKIIPVEISNTIGDKLKIDVSPAAEHQSSNDVNNLKTRLRELYLLSAEKIFNDVASESLKPYKDLVDDIDRTAPRETRKEKLRKKKVSKRKVAESIVPPFTNGTKKSKIERTDIFV